MKINYLLSCLLLSLSFIACNPTHEDLPETNDPAKTDLLTAKPWIYNEYYTGYNTSAVVTQYKKSNATNPLDLSNDFIKFDVNGTYVRRDYTGTIKTGTWEWKENQTKVSTVEDGINKVSNTLVLTGDHYTWEDTQEHTYGDMIHPDENNESRTQLLTASAWIYNEYYTGVNTNAVVSQYIRGRATNPLDLSGDYLKFEANGTYNRRDYQGNLKTGTWTWIDNETRVTTTEDGITNTSKTLVISDDHYTWVDTVSHTYGDMIHDDQGFDKTLLLTEKPWVYNEYYTAYSTGTVITQYIRGHAGNPLDLSHDFLKFEANGTYTRKDYQGNNLTGTWHFEENQTRVSTTEGGVTNVNRTMVLSKDHYTWVDPVHLTYGDMIHE